MAIQAAVEALQQIAEPVPFARLHGHIWESLANQALLERVMSMADSLAPTEWVRGHIEAALESGMGDTLAQLGESEEESIRWWWLVQPPDAPPLSERIEGFVCQALESAAEMSEIDLMHAVNSAFPGVLTPDRTWVMACLRSYGEPIRPSHWALRAGEQRDQRASTRAANVQRLHELGQRLGFTVHLNAGGFEVQWLQPDGEPLAFVVLDSARLSRLVALPQSNGSSLRRKIVIVAEARQELIRLKLSRSVWLRKPLAEQGWQFITDAELRNWAGQDQVSLADLDSFVGLDLLAAQDRTQLPLI
jgi:hypothetical protein